MCTSAVDKRRQITRHIRWNLCLAAFCGIFAAVYEHFSFGVFSRAMVFSFAAPLLTAIVLMILRTLHRHPGTLVLQLLGCTAATFAMGSIAKGVVEIYGTDEPLLQVYPVAGGILLTAALIAWVVTMQRQRA